MSGPERIWIDGAMGGRYLTASEDREDCLAPHGPYVLTPAAPTYDRSVKEYEEAYQYALALADALHKKHYAETTEWRPLGDLVGLLTQIDNMVAGFDQGELISSAPHQSAPPNGGPAYPVMWEYAENETGMSLRQYAAIKLRVPDSGTDWLDAMILQSKRDEFAGQALAAWPVTDRGGAMDLARKCYTLADSMLAARGGK